jgi:hypothetical protein
VANIGHGGYGDGDYLPMGPQPVVARDAVAEVVYTVGRGAQGVDGRWDSALVEMVLDSSTVGGMSGGEIRWIQYGSYGWDGAGFAMPPTDEQPNVMMAGNQLLGGHWALGLGVRIADRSDPLGSYATPIVSEPLPHLASQTGASAGAFDASHYVDGPFGVEPDWRGVPFGFYVYYEPGVLVYDQYWSEYATWVVSAGHVLFRANDGAIVCLEPGEPSAADPAPGPWPFAPQPPTAALLRHAPGPGMARATPPPEAPPVIPWWNARAHVGTVASVQGRIAYVHNSGKALMLAFAEPHAGSFIVHVPRAAWPAFGARFGAALGRDREVRYRRGQSVTVTGRIDWYQGDPVIVATSPTMIELAR